MGKTVVIVGAGPTGLALSAYLGGLGCQVHVYESRSADAVDRFDRCVGREIGVDLSVRGIRVLRELGAWSLLQGQCRAVRHRVFHPLGGSSWSMPFGAETDAVIYTTNRNDLRRALVQVVAETPSVCLRFGHPFLGVDEGIARFGGGHRYCMDDTVLIGCDGANSKVREVVERTTKVPFETTFFPYAFTPIAFPSALMLSDAMHMWSRDRCVVVAQPGGIDCNFKGAFLMRADVRKQHDDPAQWAAFITCELPELAPWSAELAHQVLTRPFVPVRSVRGERWCAEGMDIVVVGDAAHAMAPFLGQGMNSGLEDCRLLAESWSCAGGDWHKALRTFEASRIEDAHAVTSLSRDNYPELCEKRRHRAAAERAAEHCLLGCPGFVSFHQHVCFSHRPYREALQHSVRQQQLIDRLVANWGSARAVMPCFRNSLHMGGAAS